MQKNSVEPPHDTDSEMCIVGCCMEDPRLLDEVNLGWFYNLRYRGVIETMQAMRDAGEPIGLVTVVMKIRQADDDLSVQVAKFPDLVSSTLNFPYWAEKLEEKRILREIAIVSQTIYRRAVEKGAEAEQVAEEFEQAAMKVRSTEKAECVDLRVTMQQVIGKIDHAIQNKGSISGLETGFADLDRMTQGLKSGQMIVLAARPSVGKTSLAMNIVERLAVDEGKPVGVFSLEMDAEELLHRMVCCRAKVDSCKITRGEISEEEMARLTSHHVSKISSSPIYIIDQGGLTILQIRARARRLVSQFGVKLIVLDYLQLTASGKKTENKNADVTFVSNNTKAMARELGIPVIVLAQLSRELEKENRKPRLSDLRDSGSIEQDADKVIFLHGESETDYSQKVNTIFAKNRSGRRGSADLIFFPQYTRFESASYAEDDPAQTNIPYNDR
jgi:replicative DNA helicase